MRAVRLQRGKMDGWWSGRGGTGTELGGCLYYADSSGQSNCKTVNSLQRAAQTSRARRTSNSSKHKESVWW